MEIKRVTYNDDDLQQLDEVLILDPESVHVERMDKGHIWITINNSNGNRLVINVYTPRNGKLLANAEVGV